MEIKKLALILAILLSHCMAFGASPEKNTEHPTNPLTISLCDDFPVDGVMQIDLNGDIMNNIISTHFPNAINIKFYRDDSPGPWIEITDPLIEIENNETIYISHQHRDYPDLAPFSDPITFFVNECPIVVPALPPLEECGYFDNNGNVVATFDLTTHEGVIQDANTLTVGFEYYETQAGAENGQNAIAQPGAYETHSGVVYIKVYRISNPSVFVVKILNTDPILPPQINDTSSLHLDGVDYDGDGMAVFDLMYMDLFIIDNPSQYTFSFFRMDGNGELQPIPSTYTESDGEQVHVKVYIPGTPCHSTTSFRLRTVPPPIVIPALDPIEKCTFNPASSLADFDLTIYETVIAEANAPYSVLFYYYDQYGNEIENPQDYTSSTQNVQIRVHYSEYSHISKAATISLETHLLPPLEFSTLLCPIGLDEHGGHIFDLTQKNEAILEFYSASEDAEIRFYTSYEDAINYRNAIQNTTNYTLRILENRMDVFAVIWEEGVVCPKLARIELRADGLQLSMEKCKQPLSLYTTFYAEEIKHFIQSHFDTPVEVEGVNTSYFVYISRTIHLRVIDPTNPDCSLLIELALVEHRRISIPLSPGYQNHITLSVTPDSVSNGFTHLNLLPTLEYWFSRYSYRRRVFSQGTGGSPDPNAQISDESLASYPIAVDETGGVVTLDIWYTDSDSPYACWDKTTLTVTVEILEDTETSNLNERDTIPNDGASNFNLSEVESDLVAGYGFPYTIAYYEGQSEALVGDMADAIPDPAAFTNTVPGGQTVYARIDDTEGDSGVYIHSIELRVIPVPEIETQTNALALEDTDGDGVEAFDLTSRQGAILNGLDPSVLEISYYETEALANEGDPAQQVPNPDSYSNTANPQTVYVRVEDPTVEGSYSTASFELHAVSITIPFTQKSIYPCDGDPDAHTLPLSVDLTGYEGEVLAANQSPIEIKYQYYSGIGWEDIEDPTQLQAIGLIAFGAARRYDVVRIQVRSSLEPNIYREAYYTLIHSIRINHSVDGLEPIGTDGGGNPIFDLTARNIDIGFEDPRTEDYVEFSYHLSYGDALSGMNPLTNPTHYSNGTATAIFARVSTFSGFPDPYDPDCISIVPLQLQVAPQPLWSPKAPEAVSDTGAAPQENTGQTDGAVTTAGEQGQAILETTDYEFNELHIYPNPVDNLLSIASSELEGSVRVEVFDELGRAVLLKTLQAQGGTVQLDVSTLGSGLYFARIASNNKTTVKKIVKQ